MAHDDAEVETILLQDTTGIEFGTRGATAAITPGDLVAYDGADGAVSHGTDGGYASPRFALEADQWGKTIDDDILENEEVTFGHGKEGTRFYAWLADGENVTADTPLVSAGDGSLRAYVSADDSAEAVVCHAYEDVDNSAGGSTTRIKIEC